MKRLYPLLISFTDPWSKRHEKVPFIYSGGSYDEVEDDFYDYYGYWPKDLEVYWTEEVRLS